MLAYWRAEYDAADYLGNHDGTLMNGAGFGAGFCDAAFSFDGIDDYVSVPSSTDFDLGQADDKSFAFWWNLDYLNETTVPLSRRDSSNNALGLAICIQPTNYYLHLEVNHWVKFAADFTPGEWYHLVVTKQGSNWKLYHNGVELAVSSSMGWPYDIDATKDLPLMIGGDAVMFAEHAFTGRMDEVAFFGKTLSAAEVWELYQSFCHYCEGIAFPTPTPGSVPHCPGNMIAYWQAEGDASDYLGGYHGSLINGAGFDTGFCGTAFSFDGVDNYVSIPSNQNFDLGRTDSKSFAFWWNLDYLNETTVPLSRRDSSNNDLGLARIIHEA